MVPMIEPVLATLIDSWAEGMIATISAEHIGSSIAPRLIMGWPKATIRSPSTVEIVPVPARVMSPVASATEIASPGRSGAGGRAAAELGRGIGTAAERRCRQAEGAKVRLHHLRHLGTQSAQRENRPQGGEAMRIGA